METKPPLATEAETRSYLEATKTALLACIAANDAAPVDRIARLNLDRLSTSCRGCVRAIDFELGRPWQPGPWGTMGLWGENGNAPRIRRLIDESKFWRERCAVEVGGAEAVAA